MRTGLRAAASDSETIWQIVSTTSDLPGTALAGAGLRRTAQLPNHPLRRL